MLGPIIRHVLLPSSCDAKESNNCLVHSSILSVGVDCCDAMALSAVSMIGSRSTALAKYMNVPLTCCMNFFCSGPTGGVGSSLVAYCVAP